MTGEGQKQQTDSGPNIDSKGVVEVRPPSIDPEILRPQAMQAPQQVPATLSVVISNEYGLHLRPADLFARMAIGFVSDITVRHNDRAVNGKSILDLATLAAECGAVLSIEATGPDAESAVAALARLVESDFQTEMPKAS